MFFLQFFQREIGSSLVITHVMIPSLRELYKLGFLSCLNVGKLVFLSSTNVISLSGNFFFEKFIKLRRGFSSLGIVTFFLTFASVLFKKSQEVKNFRVRRNADNSFLPTSTLEHVSLVIVHHRAVFLYAGRCFLSSADGSLIVSKYFVFDLLH